MKTKMLLFPLMLLIMIFAIIMRIFPDWQSKEKYKNDLVGLDQQLKEVQDKNAMIDNLASIYKSKSENIEVINSYIPIKASEEDIINNLISYANSQTEANAITVSKIEVADGNNLALTKKINLPTDPGKKIVELENAAGGEKPKPEGTPSLAEMEKVYTIGEGPAKPKQLAVSISLETSYNGMKDFFKKIDSLKRFNSINSFRISSEDGVKMKVQAVLVFNYLQKYNPVTVDDSFLASSFNDGVIEKVKKRAITNTLKIEIKSEGNRENPFLP